MRTLFVAACLCVALDATAQYYPEIRTKGTVASNDAVVYADSSGRFVKSGGSLSAVPFPLASGLSVSNTAVGASNLASSASASAGSAAAYATNAMTEAVAAGTTGSVALVAVASTGSVLRAAIGTATGTVMDAVASTGTVLRTAIGTATGTVMDAVASTGTVLRTAIGAATNTAMGATASTGTVLRTAIGTATTTVMSAVAGTGTAARAYTDLAHATNTTQQIAINELVTLMDTHSQAVERVYWIGSTNREVYTTNVIGAIGYGTVGAGGATVYAPVVGVYTGITASAPTPQFMDEFSSTWYVQWIYTNWFMSDGTARWVLDTGSEPSTTDPTGTYYPFGHAETGNPTFALNEAWAAIETYTTNIVADSVTNRLESASVSNLLAQSAVLRTVSSADNTFAYWGTAGLTYRSAGDSRTALGLGGLYPYDAAPSATNSLLAALASNVVAGLALTNPVLIGASVSNGFTITSGGMNVTGNVNAGASPFVVQSLTVGGGLGFCTANRYGVSTIPLRILSNNSTNEGHLTVWTNLMVNGVMYYRAVANVQSGAVTVGSTNIAAGYSPVGLFGYLGYHGTNTLAITDGVYTNIAGTAPYTRILTNGFTGNTTLGVLTNTYSGYYPVGVAIDGAGAVAINGDEYEVEVFFNNSGDEYLSSHLTMGSANSFNGTVWMAPIWIPAGTEISLRVKGVGTNDDLPIHGATLMVGSP